MNMILDVLWNERAFVYESILGRPKMCLRKAFNALFYVLKKNSMALFKVYCSW